MGSLHRKHVVGIAALTAVLAVGVATVVLWPERERSVLEANGQVRGTEITLSAKVTGIAEVVAVKEGRPIKQGELVAQIGARDIEARLAQVTAEREAAEARLPELAAQIAAVD